MTSSSHFKYFPAFIYTVFIILMPDCCSEATFSGNVSPSKLGEIEHEFGNREKKVRKCLSIKYS